MTRTSNLGGSCVKLPATLPMENAATRNPTPEEQRPSDQPAPDDARWMDRALELARLGMGHVEPNPLVGCVVVQGDQAVGEGWHRKFGGPHAESEALQQAGQRAMGASLYVNLEPCCHYGKTPPCTEAIIRAGIRRVVMSVMDPFPEVAGKGLRQLREAGLQVDWGCRRVEAESLNAPYFHRLRTGRPWFIAKWAMTLDGRLSADDGISQWISGPESRQRVHELRGRVVAIAVGLGTVLADNPQLTARPPGPRAATRVVLSTQGLIPTDCQLWRSLDNAPLLIVVDGEACPPERRSVLRQRGADVLAVRHLRTPAGLCQLAEALGQRHCTNVLVEGGKLVLGSFFRADLLQELHVFVAPKLIGGMQPAGPLLVEPFTSLAEAMVWHTTSLEQVGDDVYWQLRRNG